MSFNDPSIVVKVFNCSSSKTTCQGDRTREILVSLIPYIILCHLYHTSSCVINTIHHHVPFLPYVIMCNLFHTSSCAIYTVRHHVSLIPYIIMCHLYRTSSCVMYTVRHHVFVYKHLILESIVGRVH